MLRLLTEINAASKRKNYPEKTMERVAKQSTRAFLHAHGLQIEPETMDRLVREALERLPRALYRDEPRRDLTAAEAEALRSGGFDLAGEDLGEDDPLVRTAAEYAALLQNALTTATAAARLRVAPSRIRQRLIARPPSLYGIRLASGWRIPEFQFEGDEILHGWPAVVAALDVELHPISVYRWFTTPNTDLEDQEGRRISPRDWLRLGHKQSTVAELAAGL